MDVNGSVLLKRKVSFECVCACNCFLSKAICLLNSFRPSWIFRNKLHIHVFIFHHLILRRYIVKLLSSSLHIPYFIIEWASSTNKLKCQAKQRKKLVQFIVSRVMLRYACYVWQLIFCFLRSADGTLSACFCVWIYDHNKLCDLKTIH